MHIFTSNCPLREMFPPVFNLFGLVLIFCRSISPSASAYLDSNGLGAQLVVVQHEPHQVGCVGQSRVGQSRDGVVLEVQVFHVRGHGGHGCQAPPIAVHGHRKGRRAVAHIWTVTDGGVRLQGGQIDTLSAAGVEPRQRVVPLGQGEREESRQQEGDGARGHGHKSAAFSGRKCQKSSKKMRTEVRSPFGTLIKHDN